jgi:hypothetical protein
MIQSGRGGNVDTGENKGSNRKTSQVTLTLDHATFALQIGGNVENLDCLLCMLDMARRDTEGRLRAIQASQVLAMPMGVPSLELLKRH